MDSRSIELSTSFIFVLDAEEFAMVMGGVLYLGWLGKMGVYQG